MGINCCIKSILNTTKQTHRKVNKMAVFRQIRQDSLLSCYKDKLYNQTKWIRHLHYCCKPYKYGIFIPMILDKIDTKQDKTDTYNNTSALRRIILGQNRHIIRQNGLLSCKPRKNIVF